MTEYVAWNGERYAGAPPAGWYLAADGRWWAPGTGPGLGGVPPHPPATRPRRPWWKKKRVLLPIGLPIVFLVVLIVIGVIVGPQDEPESEFSGGARTEVTVTTAATDPPLSDDDAEITADAMRLLLSGDVPGLESLDDDALTALALDMCAMAADADDTDDLFEIIDDGWSDFDDAERDFYGDDDDHYVAFIGASLAGYCPSQTERLGLR